MEATNLQTTNEREAEKTRGLNMGQNLTKPYSFVCAPDLKAGCRCHCPSERFPRVFLSRHHGVGEALVEERSKERRDHMKLSPKTKLPFA